MGYPSQLNINEFPCGKILEEVQDEICRQVRLKQDGRFPHICADPELSNVQCLAVLMEEVGEAASAIMTHDKLQFDRPATSIRKELIQIAAVCISWIDGLEMKS